MAKQAIREMRLALNKTKQRPKSQNDVHNANIKI